MSDLYISHLSNWLLRSPPVEWAVRQMHSLVLGALRQGPIPEHIAFVMDGNRRYARNHKIETIEGHHHGFEALAAILEICYKCGVRVVTVYAFSIENFRRPKYEVDGLMELAKIKLEQIAQHGELLDRYGASVRVLGQRDLIRADVLEVVERAVNMTKHNNRAILNICFPYTAREEIVQSVRTTVEEYANPPPQSRNTPFSQTRIRQKILSKQLDHPELLSAIRETSPSPSVSRSDGADESGSSASTTLPPDSPASPGDGPVTILPNPETITAETLDNHMYTAGDPPLDIFIRTSGVQRLSDFMLWQCHQDTHIFFLKCFWPEFDLWHFLPVLLEWQWRQKQKQRDEKPRSKWIKQR